MTMEKVQLEVNNHTKLQLFNIYNTKVSDSKYITVTPVGAYGECIIIIIF